MPPNISLRHIRELQVSPLDGLVASLAERNGVELSKTSQQETSAMPHNKHKIVPREIGMVRIYIKPSDKRKQPSLRGFLASRPLYRELIDAAKKGGLMNAAAHHTHYGFSNHGKVRAHDPEMGNANLHHVRGNHRGEGPA